MSDLIDRQAAIDAIEHRLAEPAYQHTGEDWYVGMNCAESELYELPSAQPNLQLTCNQLATDTISRQAAIDALHRYFDGMLETDTWSPCDVYGLIEILPPAQPEIIRCKNCKDYQEGVDINGKQFSRCNGSVRTYGHTMPDWYCADAERREE